MKTIDFQALIPRDFDESIGINIARAVSLGSGEGAFFTAEIIRRRFNAHGRELKGEHVITLCAKPGEELPDLLRALTEAFEQAQPVPLEEEDGGS